MKKLLRGFTYSVEEDIAYNALWAATYGSFFSLQVAARMAAGKGAPGPDDYARFAEEAATVADEAAELGPHR